jgi:hypothetical protein
MPLTGTQTAALAHLQVKRPATVHSMLNLEWYKLDRNSKMLILARATGGAAGQLIAALILEE